MLLDPLFAPPAFHLVASAFVGGAALLTALSLLDPRAPLGWRSAWTRDDEDDEDDGVRYGPPRPLVEPPTLSGRWIGIQLFGPGTNDYFAWTLSLTQRGTSLEGEVHLRMATTSGLVGAAGRVLVRGTVVGDTVTMTLRRPHTRRGPSAPYRLTLGADGHAMVGTAQVSPQAPGYLISLVRR